MGRGEGGREREAEKGRGEEVCKLKWGRARGGK